jgi:parvulin-like peptidyl-prolyl isomerase
LTKFFAAALAASLAAFSFAQVDPARIVVTVNGDEIKGGEYYRRMEFLPGVAKPMGRSYAEFPPGFLTIEQLITERLVFQLAKQKGVTPTEIEVDAELKSRTDDNPNYLKDWAATGRSQEELKYQIRYELAQFKIQTFGVTITNQEVDNHYKSAIAQYTLPKRAKLRVVVVQTEADRDAVDTALKGGKSFAEVAKQYSKDVSRGAGGEYGTVPYGFLNTPVRTAVEATTIGKNTAWITTETDGKPTYLKFHLEDVVKEEKIPLDDKLRRNIRRRLMIDKGTNKNNIQTEMMAIRQKAKIDIKQPEFADAYRKFIDAYLKQGG